MQTYITTKLNTADMKSILKQVIKDIQPSKEYETEILRKATAIIKKINASLKDAKAVLGGSGAKGTWLKTFDADIFVKFSYKKYADKSDQISSILEKELKKHFSFKKLHGSRDYFQIQEGHYTFEIVPILDIKKASEAKNITDVSPLHSQFVSRYKKLINEMRLTKQFFKAANVYGAESHIQGFSGYVCEILTIYYCSFEKLLKAIPSWKDKTVIDINNYYKGKNVLLSLNKSKLSSPLIVIDPVQADRNAAAALEYEKFERIQGRARQFLKKPDIGFFELKRPSIADLQKKYKNKPLLILQASLLDKKDDIAGAKLRKAFHFIEKELERSGFGITEKDIIWDEEPLLFFVLDKHELSPIVEIQGPFVHMKSHVVAFKKKYKKIKIANKRIVAQIKRKFTKPYDIASFIISSENVKTNVASIQVL